MRLVLLSHYYEPEVGAPQRRWAQLVPRLVAAGHEVVVVTAVPHYPSGRARPGAHGGRQEGRYGETVVRVPYVPYDRGRGRRLLDQVLTAACSLVPALRARPDVVVSTAPGLPTLLCGAVVARLLGVPSVVEMRDAWPDLVTDAQVGPRALRRLASATITRWQRRAAVVVCTSGRFAEQLCSRGIRAVHVPNGVDLDLVPPVPPVPSPRPTARGSAGRPLRVLYAGTVGESQDVAQAVRALQHLSIGTVQLTVVGHGAGLAEVRQAAARLARPQDVVLLPPVPPTHMARLLADADTALVCLRDWPAFDRTVPSKLYELLAAGRHVTGCLAGEAAAVVLAAGGGDVVHPGDTAGLAQLWDELSRDRDRLVVGQAPRHWVAAHADAAVLAGRYLDLLAGVRR